MLFYQSNMLVEEKNGVWTAAISDAGLARLHSFPIKWTAPEGAKFSKSSDIYAFGMTVKNDVSILPI